MNAKNGEARGCANTYRASIEKSRDGNIDMNNIANYELNFQRTTFHPVMDSGSMWLTSTELAIALGYADTKAVSILFNRNQDEFTPAMSMVINMTTNGINNSLRKKKVRVFSTRGAHLIAMFAETPVAKQFRRWALDMLDREVAIKPEASPIYRFQTKVIIRDNVFGGEVEFLGQANDMNKLATGICKQLGFQPTGFLPVDVDATKFRRIH